MRIGEIRLEGGAGVPPGIGEEFRRAGARFAERAEEDGERLECGAGGVGGQFREEAARFRQGAEERPVARGEAARVREQFTLREGRPFERPERGDGVRVFGRRALPGIGEPVQRGMGGGDAVGASLEGGGLNAPRRLCAREPRGEPGRRVRQAREAVVGADAVGSRRVQARQRGVEFDAQGVGFQRDRVPCRGRLRFRAVDGFADLRNDVAFARFVGVQLQAEGLESDAGEAPVHDVERGFFLRYDEHALALAERVGNKVDYRLRFARSGRSVYDHISRSSHFFHDVALRVVEIAYKEAILLFRAFTAFLTRFLRLEKFLDRVVCDTAAFEFGIIVIKAVIDSYCIFFKQPSVRFFTVRQRDFIYVSEF